MEITFEGVVGFTLPILTLPGPDTGRLLSEADSGQERPAEGLAIYLNPPEAASYSFVQPTLGNIQLNGGLNNEVALGGPPLEIAFDSDTGGQYHFICDLLKDDVFDLTGNGDYVAMGPVDAGTNTIFWDGTDDSGHPVKLGEYNCRLRIITGSLMLEMDDVETAYPGIRMFELDEGLGRSGLCMYWADGALDANAVLMPNGLNGLATSGPFGVCSGNYGDATVANENARAWGAFTATGKGNDAFLRTLVWLAEDTSGDLSVTVILPDDVFRSSFEDPPGN